MRGKGASMANGASLSQDSHPKTTGRIQADQR
jgi:hypothetical protein